MPEQVEGFVELRDGMNGYRNPALLSELQYSDGINVSARGGLVQTRPALVLEDISLPQGLFQGAGVWSLASGDRFVYVCDGVLYTLGVDSLTLVNLGSLLNATAQCFFEQVDEFMVIQDGVSAPIILQLVAGVPTVFSGTQSIPTGYTMIFAQGRLHMVPTLVPSTSQDGRAYLVSGDILQPLDNETALLFTETEYLSEGGAHSLPAEMGFIHGLGAIRNALSGTGVGQVVAFGREGVCAFDFSIQRAYWKDQALSQVLFFGAGTLSPWSILNVNNDLVYRSQDGIRVLKYSTSQSSGNSGALSNTPMSIEVDKYLVGDYDYLARTSSAAADNRVLITASGTDTYYFQGLISWDVAAGMYSGAQGVGAYDGIWTGANFAQVLNAFKDNVRTMFVFAEGPVLYRVDDDAVFDGTDTPIEARIETRVFNFGDLVAKKKLKYIDLWVSNIPTDTEFEIFYRPHGYPLWTSMGTRNIEVPAGSLPQQRNRLRFSVNADEAGCDPVSKDLLYTGTRFQFSIQWTGRAQIDAFRCVVDLLTEAPPDLCDNSEGIMLTSSAVSGITLSSFSYVI
jgi:hypothetical protein